MYVYIDDTNSINLKTVENLFEIKKRCYEIALTN